MKSQSGRGLHFRVTGSTHRSAFAFILTSETRRKFSFRLRRHALSVTQIQQKRAVNQRTFKWLHRAGLYSRSRCHEITSFLISSRSFNSGLRFLHRKQINKSLVYLYIYAFTKSPKNERGRRYAAEN